MLLRALECVEADRLDVEVIIVDNGSTDDSVTRAAARFPLARIITNRWNTGFAPACNRGAREANGEFVLFLNNDASLTRANFERLLEVAVSDNVAAIWQPVNYDPEGN